MTLQKKLYLCKPGRFFSNKSRGFSLVEISLFMLVFAIGFTALFTLVASYVSAVKTSKEKITASFLVQEGLELVLAKRNANFINEANWLQGIPLNNEFCINPNFGVISQCNGKLYLDNNNFYTHNLTDKPTVFSRKIKITPQANDSVEVVSTVNWPGNPVVLKMTMTKWHPLAK